MFELARPKIRIADLSHRVALCTMHDIIDENGVMTLARTPVMWMWAQIDAALNAPSFISVAGYSIKGSDYAGGTHRIIVRAESRVEASSAAWAYEVRRKLSPRWYKVIGWTESDHWLLLNTQLKERSEDAQPPVNMLGPQNSPVTL